MQPDLTTDLLKKRVLTDRQMALGQLRLDLESELYLTCRGGHSFDPSLLFVPTGQSPLDFYLNILEGKIEPIPHGNLGNVRRFFQESGYDSKFRNTEALCGEGVILVQGAKYRRQVAWLEEDFKHHLIWGVGSPDSNSKYHQWSAVAAQVSHFDYNYDAYVEAADRLNTSLESWRPPAKLYTLSLSEFVAVLEFRERELRRIIQSFDFRQGIFAQREWQWPHEWGKMRWSGPVLRGTGQLSEAEREYLGTRSWSIFYRLRLEPPAQSSFNVTFDEDVSAKDFASFLSFIHQRAVEHGGLGLLLHPKEKESG